MSIAIPTHDMKDGDKFLNRALASLEAQIFKDFEIVVTRDGKMAENTNSAIKKSKGDIIKILYMDDFLAHENSLQEISDNFEENDNWLVTGCLHTTDGETFINPHLPVYGSILEANTIGSPSVLTIRNNGHLLFDESMSWLLDSDLYYRYQEKYGLPKILNDYNVVIGIGEHQMTHILTDEVKHQEEDYLITKYQ